MALTPFDIGVVVDEIHNIDNRSIIVTLPSTETWEEFNQELERINDYSQTSTIRISHPPQGINKGDRCYIVHNDHIRGWLQITDIVKKTYVCGTTGQEWDQYYIERSGPFHYCEEQEPMKGFKGFRYYYYKTEENEQQTTE